MNSPNTSACSTTAAAVARSSRTPNRARVATNTPWNTPTYPGADGIAILRFVATSTSSVILSSSYVDEPVIPTASSANATVEPDRLHWTIDQKATQARVIGF